jgi:hypothetical protein
VARLWRLSPENALLIGQILFVDGGLECLARGERSCRAPPQLTRAVACAREWREDKP